MKNLDYDSKIIVLNHNYDLSRDEHSLKAHRARGRSHSRQTNG